MLNNKLNELEAAVCDLKLLTGEAIGADYRHDECPGITGTPDAVIEVGSTEQVSKLLAACSGVGVPVVVRGAGTGKAGGSVAVNGGVVLSMKGMDKILEFDEATMTLRVQPGVLLQDVKSEAAAHGLIYPPDPGEKTATIGGNAATNASGPSALKYGTTRDYIADAEIVLADGTVVKLSDNAEYAAVLGSEGTLGVITEVTLRLVPKAGSDAILLLPFADAGSCISAARKITEAGYEPSAAEYLDTDMVEYSGNVTGTPVFPVEMDGERVGATLMLTLEGEDEDAVMEKMETLAEMAEELECLDILVGDTPTMKWDFWAAHDAFHTSTETARSSRELNVNIPTEHMAQLVEYAKEQGTAMGLTVLPYGHVISGGLHIHIVSDMAKDQFEQIIGEYSATVYKKCLELGGDIAGEYGVGCAKLGYISEAQRTAFKALKADLDPKGILNPGKVAE